MRLRGSVLLAASLLAACTLAQSTESVEEQITRLEKQYEQAVRSQDVAALQRLLAEDFQAISSSGQVRNRAEEIADIGPSPDYVLVNFAISEIRVRAFNGSAIVTGRAALDTAYRGQPGSSQFRYTRVYAPPW